jgi:integrase
MGSPVPRRAKGARLYLDAKRGTWVIRDGKTFTRTGFNKNELAKAEQCLAEYVGIKYRPTPGAEPLIVEILAAYMLEVVPHKRPDRNTKYFVGNLEKWWGDRKLSDVTAHNCRSYAEGRKASMARVELKRLQAAIKHYHKEHGPLPLIPTVIMPPEPNPRDRWLSKQEAARLLRAARRVEHLRRFILLALHTGSRSGVIKSLQWSWIDFDNGIMLRKSPDDTERANKRRPRVKLGRKILAHLRRWKRLDAGLTRYVVHYDGKPIRDSHNAWNRAVKAAGLEGVTPHTIRHTRATWLMQRGVDIWQAAGFLGMTTRTLETVYAHHDPDYQSDAADL